ncbi:MAG: type II toxin-antitoxin system PemK/MazF family toxin [Candidatus Nitrosotenuis sp.]
MMSGITLNPRDIIQIVIDFGDGHETKYRPALIISNSFVNQNADSIIVLPITRNPQSDPFMLKINSSDFESGSLPFESQVILDNIFTREKSEYRKHFGRVTKDFFQRVMDKVTYDVLANSRSSANVITPET